MENIDETAIIQEAEIEVAAPIKRSIRGRPRKLDKPEKRSIRGSPKKPEEDKQKDMINHISRNITKKI